MSTKTEYVVQIENRIDRSWIDHLPGINTEADGLSCLGITKDRLRDRQARLIRRETTETVITEGGAK